MGMPSRCKIRLQYGLDGMTQLADIPVSSGNASNGGPIPLSKHIALLQETSSASNLRALAILVTEMKLLPVVAINNQWHGDVVLSYILFQQVLCFLVLVIGGLLSYFDSEAFFLYRFAHLVCMVTRGNSAPRCLEERSLLSIVAIWMIAKLCETNGGEF